MREFAVIASGFNISGNVDFSQRRLDAIFIPTLGASGTMAIQGNTDTVSGNFYRILETRVPGSGDMQFAVGVGSRYIAWNADWAMPAFARFEIIGAVGSMQTDNRTLTLITTPR